MQEKKKKGEKENEQKTNGHDLVPKGVHGKRTEVLENKVDRM